MEVGRKAKHNRRNTSSNKTLSSCPGGLAKCHFKWEAPVILAHRGHTGTCAVFIDSEALGTVRAGSLGRRSQYNCLCYEDASEHHYSSQGNAIEHLTETPNHLLRKSMR